MARVLEILVLQALAAEAQGRQTQALASLAQALPLAEPEGYLRTFLDEGAPLMRLLERHRDSLRSSGGRAGVILPDRGEQPGGALGAPVTGRLLAYTEKLLDGFQSELSGSIEGLPPSPSPDTLPAWVEPLSSHELAVLRLLAAGLSAPQVAEKYVLSINTIKTQIKSVYAKLGVHSRAEALAAARELHLL